MGREKYGTMAISPTRTGFTALIKGIKLYELPPPTKQNAILRSTNEKRMNDGALKIN